MVDSGNYAARATAIRETAKWIAAVFAAAGAVLFSGLSFTNVEKAASTQDWELPVVLAAVPILAAAAAVWAAAWVILQAPPATDELLPTLGGGTSQPAARERSEVEKLRPATVAVYADLDAFEAEVGKAQAALAVAEKAYVADRQEAKRGVVDARRADLQALQDGVRDVLLCADYLRVKRRYNVARLVFLGAALVATAAAAWSGVKAGEADRDKVPSAAAITSATPVKVYRRSAKTLPCGSDGQSAVAEGGDYSRPVLVLLCDTSTPWTPRAGDVVLVPEREAG
jgi:hypothetical protein